MDQGKLILIVDNDDAVINAIENMVSKYTSHKTIKANTGIDAVHQAMVNYRINLILMDIKMPVMDGYDATARIKKIRPNLPIIAVTSFTESKVKEKILKVGCNDIITKPIEIDKFLTKIKSYLK